MATERLIDCTSDFNADGRTQLDIGSFDYADVQLVSPTGTVNFENTNDANAITGVSDGSSVSATNWVSVQGTNLATGTGVTSLAASGIVRFQSVATFLRLLGAGVTATKVLVRLYKIN